jgi:hypothetical protein
MGLRAAVVSFKAPVNQQCYVLPCGPHRRPDTLCNQKGSAEIYIAILDTGQISYGRRSQAFDAVI